MKQKRILAVLLALATVFSLLPISPVFAETSIFDGGGGSAGSPYEIKTPEQLSALANSVNQGNDYAGCYFKLTADIDLSQNEWTPIGRLNSLFNGSFDGDNKKITGMNVNAENEYYLGLFGCVDSNGTVKNLTVCGSVKGNETVGGIVGYNFGTVTNCVNEAVVNGNNNVGGVVGFNYGGAMSKCTNNASISGKDGVGGVAGVNQSYGEYKRITESRNTGTVTGTVNVGGIAGTNSQTIYGCVNTNTVSGTEMVGGVAGFNDYVIEKSSNAGKVGMVENEGEPNKVGGIAGLCIGDIKKCYNNGEISGNNRVGGIAGQNEKGIFETYNTGAVSGKMYVGGVTGCNSTKASKVARCYNTGEVSGNDYVGGIAGDNAYDIGVSYNTGKVSGNRNVGGISGGAQSGSYAFETFYLNTAFDGEGVSYQSQKISAEQFKTSSTFGWDFSYDWVMGVERPLLRNNTEPQNFEIKTAENTGEKVTATVFIPAAGTYTLAFVKYDGKKLDKINTVLLTVSEGELGTKTVSATMNITLNKDDKIMLWSDLANVKPLCKEYKIK